MPGRNDLTRPDTISFASRKKGTKIKWIKAIVKHKTSACHS
jgi:plasmid replication initiation protein